jgi:hypothetical protein
VVTGVLLAWVKEDDHDFHLIIASANNHTATIVAEIPDPRCKAVCSAGRPLSKEAAIRAMLESELGTAPETCHQFVRPIPIRVVGVGFFDTPGGHATGHPPNGFELHPVLDLTLNNGQSVSQASQQTHSCSL